MTLQSMYYVIELFIIHNTTYLLFNNQFSFDFVDKNTYKIVELFKKNLI